MDIDQKLKELADMFAKTGQELSDMVKRNEKFLSEEVKRVEDVIRKASKACGAGKMDRLREVTNEYAKRMKICNEKAAAGLKAAKANYDEKIGSAGALVSEVKEILKDCLETNEFIKSIAGETKEAAEQRRQAVQQLNGTVDDVEHSVTGQLKEAAKCYADAQANAMSCLQKIIKDTKDCVEKMN